MEKIKIQENQFPEKKNKSIASDNDNKQLEKQPIDNSQKIRILNSAAMINKNSIIDDLSDKYSNNINIAYEEAVLDRKKDAFGYFQQWEEKRASALNTHRKYIETVVYRLDNQSTFGIKCLDGIINFFKERADQEEAYAKTMTTTNPKLGSLFHDVKVAETTHGVLPKVYKEFIDYHAIHGKGNMQMAEYIRSTIVTELFDTFCKDYVRKIDSFKESILEKKKRLVLSNKETAEKYAIYGRYFNKGMKSGQLDKSKDIYIHELGFLQVVKNQMKLEAELGKETFEYMENLKRLEIQRIDYIKRGFTKYLLKMTELFGKSRSNPDILIKVIEALNPNEDIDKFFNVNTFLKEDEILFLKTEFPKVPQITLTEIKTYLQSFDFKAPPKSSLLMKEWKVTKEAGLLKGFRPYLIVATVDYNLILIEEKVEVNKPEKIMKISQINLIIDNRRDPTFVEVLEIIPGLLIDSKNKILLKFENSDMSEEFIHFINNYNTINESNVK